MLGLNCGTESCFSFLSKTLRITVKFQWLFVCLWVSCAFWKTTLLIPLTAWQWSTFPSNYSLTWFRRLKICVVNIRQNDVISDCSVCSCDKTPQVLIFNVCIKYGTNNKLTTHFPQPLSGLLLITQKSLWVDYTLLSTKIRNQPELTCAATACIGRRMS